MIPKHLHTSALIVIFIAIFFFLVVMTVFLRVNSAEAPAAVYQTTPATWMQSVPPSDMLLNEAVTQDSFEVQSRPPCEGTAYDRCNCLINRDLQDAYKKCKARYSHLHPLVMQDMVYDCNLAATQNYITLDKFCALLGNGAAQ
jgi:hypothetical protein